MNSKQKGKRMELEFAKFLSERGIKAKRGQQFKGGENSPDVISDLDNIHFEVKSTERFTYNQPLKQAIDDSNGTRTPVVVHRYKKTNQKNSYPRGEWVAILLADDFVNIVAELKKLREESNAQGQM